MGSDKVIRDAELPEISVVFEGMDASAVFKSIGGGEKLNPEWKDTKEGMVAFGRAILDNPNNPSGMHAQWEKELQQHHYDVTGIESLLPAPVVTGITNAFDKRGCGLYPLLHKMSIKSWKLTENMVDPSAAAKTIQGPNTEAQRFKQPLTIHPRTVDSGMMASCVEIDHDDVQSLCDTPADLVTYLTVELSARLVNMIEKAVLFPSADAKIRAVLFSVVADADADATTGGDQLSSLMASSRKAEAETPTIADLIKLNELVTADGPRVLVTSRQTLAAIQLSAAGGGCFVGPDVVASVLGVDKVLTPSWWTDDSQRGAEAIILVPSHYLLVGGDVNSYAQFTLYNNTGKNTDEFRSEPFVGGSLDSAHAAAVLTPITETAETAAHPIGRVGYL